MKKLLNGVWQFKSTEESQWLQATVPGCNFLDLMENNVIEDPFIGLNEKDVEWVGQKDFEYKKTFKITADELNANHIYFVANQLDTICDVYINDALAFSSNNCFVKQSYDIKDMLVAGDNTVRIYFHSPVNYVKEKHKECNTPVNSNGQNGIVHIRKPQCHFGWDWGPVLPLSGITDDIYLEVVNEGKIDYLNVTQNTTVDHSKVTVKVDASIYDECEVEIVLTHPNGEVQTALGTAAIFEINKPDLWWTYDISGKKEQSLYTITANLKAGKKVVDTISKKIGIRTLELNRDMDEYGKNFQFRLNGVPIFAKGANYIPPDSFITRFGKKEMAYLLDAFQFSNMNVLRIWGGGYYGSDALYDECDRRGILVWQDFMFACQAYPFFLDDFLDNVKTEIEYNVKRIAHHPSMALWCGNNEIEDMHGAWLNMPKYISWTEKFFYNILEPEIRKFDTATPYTQGSPIGISHNKGVYADNVGDTHLWGVWHGLKPMKYYRSRPTRFCSEFGFESLPDLNAIRIFAKPEDYDLASPVMKSHQKCMNGNDKMIYYIATRFHLPKHFRDYVYLSQVTQLECISDATEFWRRNKGRCNGSMYWQFNDCWGVCSWSSLDYYGNYKALQYGAKHFDAPLMVTFDDEADRKDNPIDNPTKTPVQLHIINDLLDAKDVECELALFNFENGIVEKKSCFVENLKDKYVIDCPKAWLDCNKKENALVATLFCDGQEINRKTLLLDKEKHLSFSKAKLSTKIYVKGDKLELHIKTDKFARLVKAEAKDCYLPFSDNFFDLLPNEERVITMSIPAGSGFVPKEVAKNITVYSLMDIDFDKSKTKSVYKRVKLYFSPVNLANAAHHGKVPKPEKL